MSVRARQDKALSEKNLQILRTLLKEADNKFCADCQSKDPRWASWNLGIFVCIRCSGIHRSMGTHISRVKSVDLDVWTPEQVASIAKWGNRRANLYWQAHLKPGHVVPEHKIESFIRSKYDGRKWVRSGPPPADPRILDNGNITSNTNSSINNPITQIKQPQQSQHRIQKPSTTTTSTLLDLDTKPPSQTKSANDLKPKIQIKTPATISKPPQKSASDNNLFDLDLTSPSSNSIQSPQQPKKANKQDIMSLFSTAPPPTVRPLSAQSQPPQQQPPKQDLQSAFANLTFDSGSSNNNTNNNNNPLGDLWGLSSQPSQPSQPSVDLFGKSNPPPRASTAPIPPSDNVWGISNTSNNNNNNNNSKSLLDDDDEWGPTTSANDNTFDDWGDSSWSAPPPPPSSNQVKTQSNKSKIELTNAFSPPPPASTSSTSNQNSLFNDTLSSIPSTFSNDSNFSDTSSKFSNTTAFADIPTSLNDIPPPSKLTSDPFSSFQSTSATSISMNGNKIDKSGSSSGINADFFGTQDAWSTPEATPSVSNDNLQSLNNQSFDKGEENKLEENVNKVEPISKVTTGSVWDSFDETPTISSQITNNNSNADNDLWGSMESSTTSSKPVIDDNIWSQPPSTTEFSSFNQPETLHDPLPSIPKSQSNPPPPPPPTAEPSIEDLLGSNVWAK